MNNFKLRKLSNLNLIWIENHGFWVYPCPTCGQIALERKDEELVSSLPEGGEKSC